MSTISGYQDETRALTFSMIASGVLGAGAVIWGIVSGATVILFDGVYMLAGILLVGISLLSARAAASEPTAEFPFGRHAATPLAVVLQGAALIGTVIFGASDAISVILRGGSEAPAAQVVAYGATAFVASVIVLLILRRPARQSSLVYAERIAWRSGALLSLVVVVGGSIGVALMSGGNPTLAAYIDPVLVLLASALIAPLAIGLVRDGLRQLLEAAPSADTRESITRIVEHARAEHGLPTPFVRSTALGRRLYVEVDFVVTHDAWRIEDEDQVRHTIIEELGALDYDVWANIALTADPHLAE